MPELPFIQVLVENLAARITGRTVQHVHLVSPSVLKTVEPPLSEAQGRSIETVRRTGKLILLDLNDGLSVAFHLMLNGRLQLHAARGARRAKRLSKDVAVIMTLDDHQELRFVEIGPKKRAALYVLPTEGIMKREPLAGLGIDPLSDEFTPDRLKEMLALDSGQLKHFLTLQRYITGIGNAFSDEILWEAKLSPFVRASKLGPEETATLYRGIRATLIRGLEEHRRVLMGNLPTKEPVQLLRVHRHGGEPCPRCGTKIAEVAYAERETYYCPSCQTAGKVYADRRMSRLFK